MSLQRAFVFLNYRDYTAALHVAVSLTNWGIKSLLAIFFLLCEKQRSCLPGFRPRCQEWGFSPRCCQCELPHPQAALCPTVSSGHFSAGREAVSVLSPPPHCELFRTIISAQVGWLSFQALSRLPRPKSHSSPYSLFCRNPSQWYPESISLSKCVWHLALFTQKWQYLVPEVPWEQMLDGS